MSTLWPDLVQADMLRDLEVSHVLVEFEGPQITLAADASRTRYLGLAAEDRDEFVRWIYAPVSMLEIRGLASGDIATRDVFLKERVLVLDVSLVDETFKQSWEVDGSLLPEFALPEVGAYLPALTQRYLKELFPFETVADRELALEQLEAPSTGVSFKALSQTLDVFQRLWSALTAGDALGMRGRYSGAEKSQLSFAQAVPGSLRVEVSPADEATFDSALQRFRELVSESSAPDFSAMNIDGWGARLVARYTELLRTLSRNNLQLLATCEAGAVYLSSGKAKHVLSKLELRALEEVTLEVGVGYFVAYSASDLRFEFFDEKEDQTWKGDVDASFREECPIVTVGEEAKYAIVVRMTRSVPAGELVERVQLWKAQRLVGSSIVDYAQ